MLSWELMSFGRCQGSADDQVLMCLMDRPGFPWSYKAMSANWPPGSRNSGCLTTGTSHRVGRATPLKKPVRPPQWSSLAGSFRKRAVPATAGVAIAIPVAVQGDFIQHDAGETMGLRPHHLERLRDDNPRGTVPFDDH